jgi:hypothetical protein
MNKFDLKKFLSENKLTSFERVNTLDESMRNVTKEDLKTMSREELIAWLQWNDRNGVYSDEDSELEGRDPVSREEALEIALRQIEG